MARGDKVGFLEAVMAFVRLTKRLNQPGPIPEMESELEKIAAGLEGERTEEFAAAVQLLLQNETAAAPAREVVVRETLPMPAWDKHPGGKGKDTRWTAKLEKMNLRVERKLVPNAALQRGRQVIFEGFIDDIKVAQGDTLSFVQSTVWVEANKRRT